MSRVVDDAGSRNVRGKSLFCVWMELAAARAGWGNTLRNCRIGVLSRLRAMPFDDIRTRGSRKSYAIVGILSLALLGGIGCAGRAKAADTSLDKKIRALSAQLELQQKELAAQKQELDTLRALLARKSGAVDQDTLADQEGRGISPPVASGSPTRGASEDSDGEQVAQNASSTVSAPGKPVGRPPEEQPERQVVQSLPEGLAVLLPQGHFALTPSVEYTQTTNDRLVYRGVVIVPGINLGEVEASTDDRSIVSGVADLRFGVTNRLEFEARVPFTYSSDRATILSQGPNGSATQTLNLSNSGLGDVELGARYQLNRGLDDWPVFVANARVKTDTGLGPFDVKRDPAGIAEQVALGSGFWAIEGGFSVLKVSDPAVLFGSVNYTYGIAKNVDKTIGTVYVGRVEPSDAIGATLGFGFAVNPEFSFSVGYQHDYVFPQKTMLGTTAQSTTSLEVGALTLGMAYRLSSIASVNANFEFGVTNDAPDMRAVFSVPVNF